MMCTRIELFRKKYREIHGNQGTTEFSGSFYWYHGNFSEFRGKFVKKVSKNYRDITKNARPFGCSLIAVNFTVIFPEKFYPCSEFSNFAIWFELLYSKTPKEVFWKIPILFALLPNRIFLDCYDICCWRTRATVHVLRRAHDSRRSQKCYKFWTMHIEY